MNIEIRAANLADLDAIIGLIKQDAINLNTKSREEYLRAFAEIAANPDNELIVATIDREVIGTLQLTFIPGLSWGRRAQVEAVRVRQDLRNLRIGTRLMAWAIDRSREHGCTLLQLTTNVARKDAHRFYTRVGFTSSHVGMRLRL